MTETYADICLERADKATKGPWEAERIYHNDGSINYEINDRYQLVAFREQNFEEPIRAKFNADFYAHASTDVPELAIRLKIVCAALAILKSGLERNITVHPEWVQKVIDVLEAIPEKK